MRKIKSRAVPLITTLLLLGLFTAMAYTPAFATTSVHPIKWQLVILDKSYVCIKPNTAGTTLFQNQTNAEIVPIEFWQDAVGALNDNVCMAAVLPQRVVEAHKNFRVIQSLDESNTHLAEVDKSRAETFFPDQSSDCS